MLSEKQLRDAAKCSELKCHTCKANLGKGDCSVPIAQTALALADMLKRLEWILARDKYGEHITRCPDCGEEREEGHAVGCELAKILKGLEVEE